MSNRVICPAGMVLVRLRVAAISASRPTAGAFLCGRPCLRRTCRGFVALVKFPARSNSIRNESLAAPVRLAIALKRHEIPSDNRYLLFGIVLYCVGSCEVWA